MSDSYESVRSLSFTALAPALGINLERFKRVKDEYKGYCPVHGSKNNNNCFSYADSGKFHCFSCSAKGSGAIDLAKLVKGLGFQQAVELLKPLVGTNPSPAIKRAPEPIPGASEAILKPFDGSSYRKFAIDCPWLNERIPNRDILSRYEVFCYHNPARRSAYSGRVMLPIKDVEGVLYGYLGRSTSWSKDNQSDGRETPKYLFPKEFPRSRFLFGLHELRQHLADTGHLPSSRYAHLFLVESPFCVMKFASLGLAAVSCYGWSVSEEQIELICQLAKGVVYLPDRNKRQECLPCLGKLAERLWVRFPQLPCEDPEMLSHEQILALTR